MKIIPKNVVAVRIPCVHGYGRQVLSALGAECRKCKKKRLRAGLKHRHRLMLAENADLWRKVYGAGGSARR